MNKYDRDFWTIFGLTKGQLSPMIQEHIKAGIRKGLLKPGDKLPPHRTLSKHMEISTSAVRRAYDKLQEQGWLHSGVGSATIISHDFPNYEEIYPEVPHIVGLPAPIGKSMILSLRPNALNFLQIGSNSLDLEAYTVRKLFSPIEDKQMKYAYPQEVGAQKGEEVDAFKASIFAYLTARRHMSIGPDNLALIFDRKLSLDQVLSALLTPVDVLINTSPGDRVLGELLQRLNINTIELDLIKETSLLELEMLLQKHEVKALYVRPQCSYPEGFSLEPSVCEQLIVLAKRYHLYILEEEDDHEFWYDLPYKPLVRYDHQGYVIHLSAFSQLDPYLYATRVLVASQEFIAAVKARPLESTFLRKPFLENAFSVLIQNGKFEELLNTIRRLKTRQCFECYAILTSYFGAYAQISNPDTGLNIWMVFHQEQQLVPALNAIIESGLSVTYTLKTDGSPQSPNVVRYCFATWNDVEAEKLAKALVPYLNG